MKNKVYKLQEIDDEIINLYIECFKSDKIYTSRDRNILKNRDLIKKIFDYYQKYGVIFYIPKDIVRKYHLCAH